MFLTDQGVIKPIVYIGMIQNERLLLVKYKTAPNPQKTGWWIPAPGLEYGDDPKSFVERSVREFGFSIENMDLMDVESFVTPGGWHLLYHYAVQVKGRLGEVKNVKEHRWASATEVRTMNDLAHGAWEMELALHFLNKY